MSELKSTRVAVVALGCPKALVDCEKMLAELAEAGCVVGAPPEEADVILINTCSFVAPAVEESMEAIRAAAEARRAGDVRRLVVAGCLPQRQGGALLEAVPEIDAMVGVHNRDDIVRAVTGDGRMVRVDRAPGGCLDDRGRFRLTPRHTAYLRLAEGCSSGCSYCTIPAIRGPLRSKPTAALLDEAAELAADGAVELNLIAQDTTAYGADRTDGANLPDLLCGLDAVEGLRWIRLMYAHPRTLTDAVIDALAECTRAVPYLDMPIQHISDKVLAGMGRGYDRRRVEAVLAALRERVSGIALRTTFIVGFPGEGREEFGELCAFVERERFDAVGVFPYWPEEGTRAARLGGQIADRTRHRRRDRLMRLQQEIAFAANSARVGTALDVLIDGLDPQGRTVGRHPGQAPDVDGLCLLTDSAEPGGIVSCEVVDSVDYDLVVQPIPR